MHNTTEIEKSLENYPLIPMDDIEDEARLLAVRWVEGYEPAGFDIQNKHKLASDIMNYAKRQKLNSDSTAENKGQQKGMKWVKASERLSEPFKDVIVRNIRTGKVGKTSNMKHSKGFDIGTGDFDYIETEWLDESATDKPEELQEKQEEGFVARMISELPEYGIDTSKWEYLHGDCCYGGAMEFVSRCIKGASEPAEELQEEVERLRDGVEILKDLCQLKIYKDKVGKDLTYQKTQPELWQKANDFLNGLVKYKP